MTEERQDEIKQFVVFTIDKDVFAAEMELVQEIIRVPEVVKVPLSPKALLGLANLRGTVLPIVSLRSLLGFPSKEHDESTRALVVDVGQVYGFVVDKVSNVLSVEKHRIEAPQAVKETVSDEVLKGVIKDVGGFSIVMILDFPKLVSREFATSTLQSRAVSLVGEELTQKEDQETQMETSELQFVSFNLSNQEYAVDISKVQEIVQMPEKITSIPNAPSYVVGLVNLRGRLLPLISGRALFSLPLAQADEKTRIVVLSVGEFSVGLVADSVSEVLRVPKDVVERVPPLLLKDTESSGITEICKLNGGKRLVSVVSVESLFRQAKVKEVLEMARDETQELTQDIQDTSYEETQLVVFQLGSDEFGVPIDVVQEIVRVPDELTYVPKASSFVEGVINLRGLVLPVIDLRKRLGLPTIERNERQRIMVFMLNGLKTGFIVDAVTEVLKIPNSAIEDAPKLSEEQSKLINKVVNLERQKRLIQLIDPTHILGSEDKHALTNLPASVEEL